MTKLFGEYLVEKGHLTKSSLLEALVQQIKTIPSITEVIFNEKLMDHEKHLQILLQQHQKKIGFIEAAKQLNLWSDELHSEVDKYITQKKIPLGEILVKSGTITLDVIAEALDIFLTETKFIPEEKQKQIVASGNSTGNFNKDLSTYFEQFSLETYLELKILLTLSHHKPLSLAVITKAMDTLQIYKGTARFMELPKSEMIISGMLKNLELISAQDPSLLSTEKIDTLEGYELNALEVLWQIREELENKKEEEMIIKEFNLTSIIDQILQGVK